VSDGWTWSDLAIFKDAPTDCDPFILILVARVSKFWLNAVFLFMAGSLLLKVIKFVFVKYPFYDILAGWLILFNCVVVKCW